MVKGLRVVPMFVVRANLKKSRKLEHSVHFLHILVQNVVIVEKIKMVLTGDVFWSKLPEDLGVSKSLCGLSSTEEREELELAEFELQTAAVGQEPISVDNRPPVGQIDNFTGKLITCNEHATPLSMSMFRAPAKHVCMGLNNGRVCNNTTTVQCFFKCV